MTEQAPDTLFPSGLRVVTELGEFLITLYPNQAPLTCAYFASLVEMGALDGSSFFRIVGLDNANIRTDYPIEVVQGGLKTDERQPLPPVAHETTAQTGLSHHRWSVSTAREAPGETYGSFFICMRDEFELDYGGNRHPDGEGFAAFGKVTEGHDTISKLFAKRESQEFLFSPPTILEVRLV